MSRFIEVRLARRGVACIAELLDEEAPTTAQAVWDSLPLGGEIYHAKYARNEVYTFVPPLSSRPGLENPTITPIPGDLVYFAFTKGQLPASTYGYDEASGQGAAGADLVVDLALFYGRNNLLINGDVGFVPGNVFGSVVEGLQEMAAACNDVWRAGSIGERLEFRRIDER